MAKEPTPKKPVLPQSEIAALAKLARFAWDTGEPQRSIDSKGEVWEFEPVRDTAIRLEVRRYGREIPGEVAQLLASGFVTQVEFGTETADAILAAKINAISDPA